MNRDDPGRFQNESSGGIVVFDNRGDATCVKCGGEIMSGDYLRMMEGNPVCITCGGLADLVFLPRGDPAITRRAGKHSPRRAVVVRWSRARKRYERQGTLVEPAAIEKAREECAADEQKRERSRAKAAVKRTAEEAKYLEAFTSAIREHFPHCPAADAAVIAQHACEKYSGRVGRSAMAKELEQEAVMLAVIAHIRHTHTSYDRLMDARVGKREARERTWDAIEAVLQRWRMPL